jgi:ribosomal protein S18 acetylase RimI-like enzyme
LSGEDSEVRVWLCERNGNLVGFLASGRAREPSPYEGAAEIFAIYQEEQVAGTGVGRLLLEFALDDLRSRGYDRVVLWVLDSNSRARQFYERAGLRFDGGQKSEEVEGHQLCELRYECGLVPTPDGGGSRKAFGS